jgi:hypothetical protein
MDVAVGSAMDQRKFGSPTLAAFSVQPTIIRPIDAPAQHVQHRKTVREGAHGLANRSIGAGCFA